MTTDSMENSATAQPEPAKAETQAQRHEEDEVR